MSQNQARQDLPGAASPGTPEAERIRAYLQGQSAKLSLADLCTKVRTDMDQFRAALFATPANTFTQRPSSDDWSANEIAAHLLEVSRSVSQGIQVVLDSGTAPPGIGDRMKPAVEIKTASEWWDLLIVDRNNTLKRISSATGDEYPDIKWEHGVFGDLNWREWLLFMRVHDLDHARQILAVSEALAS